MERLKSSFKSLQGAIVNIKPSPVCIQQPQTHSLGEAGRLFSSFCHLYCDHDSPSSAASGLAPPPPFGIHLPCLDDRKGNDDVCSDAATMSSSSSTSTRTIRVPNEECPGSFSPGSISSKRFFFSPRTTKSIMEEAKRESDGFGGGGKTCGESGGEAAASFREGSTTVSMASRDPYCDFRASMEEMVAAHELRDWRCLQELLHCYLSLNEKKQHKVIVLAFVDLLMQLMSREKEDRSSSPFLPRPDLELSFDEK